MSQETAEKRGRGRPPMPDTRKNRLTVFVSDDEFEKIKKARFRGEYETISDLIRSIVMESLAAQ